MHLDLSYNSLSAIDLRIIEDGLRNNRTLLGVHIAQEGFETYVDALGFINIDSNLFPDMYEIH